MTPNVFVGIYNFMLVLTSLLLLLCFINISIFFKGKIHVFVLFYCFLNYGCHVFVLHRAWQPMMPGLGTEHEMTKLSRLLFLEERSGDFRGSVRVRMNAYFLV